MKVKQQEGKSPYDWNHYIGTDEIIREVGEKGIILDDGKNLHYSSERTVEGRQNLYIEFRKEFRGRKNLHLYKFECYWRQDAIVGMLFVAIVFWQEVLVDNIISTPAQNITKLVKIPSLDVDFSIYVTTLELPYKTTYGNIHIVTLKGEVYLEHDASKKKLTTRFKSLPVYPIVGPDRLKDRPRIRPKPENIRIILPEYITLTNYESIEEIPITIIVNEIHGSIEWR